MDLHDTPASPAQDAPPRFDLYTTIHKALRALMADTLLAVGRMDTEDELEFAHVTERVLELLQFCAGHLMHEDRFVHPVLEARASGASGPAGEDHKRHQQDIARLAGAVQAIRAGAPAQRPAQALALYRELSLFVAENFEHMHREETEHQDALWAAYSDDELLDVHNRLVASIAPEEMLFTMRWMVPFMNPAERAAVLGGMRAQAPAEAFEAVLNAVRPHMDERERAKLDRALA